MGAISKKLAARLRRKRGLLEGLCAQITPRWGKRAEVPTIDQLVADGRQPLHAAYGRCQNLASVFAETVSGLPELAPYYDLVSAAEDEYVPGGPPMSPLTRSYFTHWAFFDCRFGPDGETIGTCLLDVADLLDLDPITRAALRCLQDSRMGIYEHSGHAERASRLRELMTDDEFVCDVPAGYRGQEGELWFVRLAPPLQGLGDRHVALTTPYVLTAPPKADWVAYLKGGLPRAAGRDVRAALSDLLKYGRSANEWNEHVLLAYKGGQFDAIFLAGLPDGRGRPFPDSARGWRKKR